MRLSTGLPVSVSLSVLLQKDGDRRKLGLCELGLRVRSFKLQNGAGIPCSRFSEYIRSVLYKSSDLLLFNVPDMTLICCDVGRSDLDRARSSGSGKCRSNLPS